MKFGRSRTLSSPKYLQKKRKKRILVFSFLLVCSVVCLTILIGLLHLPFLQIKNIEISEQQDAPQIISLVQTHLQGSYGYIIPRSLFLFYPKEEIYTDIGLHYKDIETMKSHLKGLTTLSFNFKKYNQEVVVCDGFREDENADTCYSADSKGYVFEKVATSSPVYFKYYNNSASSTNIGTTFIGSSKFNQLQTFVKNLDKYQIQSTGILISDGGIYELYIKNKDTSTAIVYFDDRTEFNKTLSNLVVFLQSMPRANFEYINLQFGNNVFYLVKNEPKK